jgi:hypothetical protein
LRFNPASAEDFSQQSPEIQSPELRLIQGGGEIGADVDDFNQPDLYVVPDPGDPVESTLDPGAKQQEAAELAGRILTGASSGNTYKSAKSKPTKSTEYDDYYRRGGGGGSAYRKYLEKLAAEQHEDECLCHICGDK